MAREERTATRTEDGTYEIRHVKTPGPQDDFWGVAEHEWTVVHVPSGRVLGRFEGSDYGSYWLGAREVCFSASGKDLIVEEMRCLPLSGL